MSCFYSAVPAFALEVLSLGSILVKRRTQDLNLQIPLFCCNISDNEEQRKQQIGSLLIRVLAEVSFIYIFSVIPLVHVHVAINFLKLEAPISSL